MPEVWRIRSCTSIGRAGTSPLGVTTFMSLKAGKNFDTGSEICSLPSSTRIMAATVAMGLVME
jgi:hypothetical protein